MTYRPTPLFRFFIFSLLMIFLCLLGSNPSLRRAEYNCGANAGEESTGRLFPPASIKVNYLLTHG